MELNYYLPSLHLQPYVSVHCVARGQEAFLHTLPSLLAQFQVRLEGEITCLFPDGRERRMPSAALCGPSNGAFRMTIGSRCTIMTVGFLAEGWSALVGASAAELADDVVDAGLVWGPGVVESLMDAVCSAPNDIGRVAVMERFLSAGVARGRAADPRLIGIDSWLERSFDLSLDALAAELGVSHRQAARLTQALHGASPKLLAMKYRALRSAARLAVKGEPAFDRCLVDYADQPHFIRDFRRFVGWTPGAFLRDQHHLSRATMEGRWRIGARRPLSLWS